MKKVLIYISLGLLFACENPQFDYNEINIHKIKIGMTHKKVLLIMGLPDYIKTPPLIIDEYDLQYIAPMGNSDNFHIYMSRKDSFVLRIDYGR